jgi:hypothetical protein
MRAACRLPPSEELKAIEVQNAALEKGGIVFMSKDTSGGAGVRLKR